MYKVIISPKAKCALKTIDKFYGKVIARAIDDITQTPSIGKPLTRDLTGRYSYKVGIYRVLYTINKKDKIISIITAGHRATIYN